MKRKEKKRQDCTKKRKLDFTTKDRGINDDWYNIKESVGYIFKGPLIDFQEVKIIIILMGWYMYKKHEFHCMG